MDPALYGLNASAATETLVPSPRIEEALEWRDESLRKLARDDFFSDIGSGIAGLQGQCVDRSTRRFHFLPAGDEMRPVRSLHQHIGQNRGNQLAWRVFIEQCHRIDS